MPNNARPNRIAETSGTGFSQDFLLFIASLFYNIERTLQQCRQVAHKIFPGQAFAHCPKFSTADPYWSLDLISVLMWLPYLSTQLRIVSLVSFYPTNNLILYQPI